MAAAKAIPLKHLRVRICGAPCVRPLVMPLLGHRLRRCFSEEAKGTLLDKPEVSERIISVVKDSGKVDPSKWAPCSVKLQKTIFGNSTLQKFGFSTTTTPEPAEEANQSTNEEKTVDDASVKAAIDGTGTEVTNGSSDTSSVRKKKTAKRIAFSDSDEEAELSVDDLVKLVDEKEELLKVKHKEIEKMQDKVLRSYAEMENVLDRTKREAENAKKYAIQNFAKSLLDVADNLGRASSVVKESFSKIDASKDSAGTAPLLKTLLEGVDMTEKQLAEVFRKFGIEKYDPINERFDPHRHHALFQIPDASKPPGTVAAVLKAGYTLHDRIIRPAEVGVIKGSSDGDAEKGSEG